MPTTPEPLVPAHIDLRDFAFMPLDVARLRDSAIVDEVSGDEFRAAILLWCAAWHQVPAGSLPKDPKQLSKFAGYGRVVAEWEKVAEGALYGWVECSDGRLYHPVVAEKAIEAWEKKAEYTERTNARAEQARAAAGARWKKNDTPTAGGNPGGNGLDHDADASADADAVRTQCDRTAGAMPKYKGQGQGDIRDQKAPRGDARGGEERGSDELGGRLRPLVGDLPVCVDPDLTPIRKLLLEGLTVDDVEAGIRAYVERGRRKPRAWGDFENWIRRAAKDRLEIVGRAPGPSDRPAPLPDPIAMRAYQVRMAASFIRGDAHPSWPKNLDPDHPDCDLAEDVVDDARRVIEAERAETPQQRANRLGYVLEPLH